MPVAVTNAIDFETFQTLEDRVRHVRQLAEDDYADEARKALLIVVDDFRDLIPGELCALASAKSGQFLRLARKVNAGFGDADDLAKITFEMLSIGESILDAAKELRGASTKADVVTPVADTAPESGYSYGIAGPTDNVVALQPPAAKTFTPALPPDVQPRVTKPNFGSVVVRATKASKNFSSTQFELADLSFELKLGQITALVGRNGAGKSTLLRLVLGELAPDSGLIEYPMLEDFGRRHVGEHMGYVAQRSVRWRGRLEENLEFYAAAYGMRGRANSERVTWLLNRFGLVGYEDHTWAQLSGGYQLRFDLARALLHRPSLLILDEPLANLDVVSQQEFLLDLKSIANSRGSEAAILVTSQHLFEMEAIADQLILLREGQKIFLEDIDRLGEGRPANSFELRTDASEQYLLAALRDLQIRSVRRFTTHYQLDFPVDVEQADILRALAGLPGTTTYIRDISRSTRPLMTSAQGTE